MGGSEIRELFPAILLGHGILAFMGMLPIQPKDVMLILERTYMPTQCAPCGLVGSPSILVLVTIERKQMHSPGTNHNDN